MIYEITPVPKPRQTRSDKWKKRPCVMRYREFADEIRLNNIIVKPGDSVVFTLPMPKSWSEKKKRDMNEMPHLQTPDLDNILKSLLDACHKQDSGIWWLQEIQKKWGYFGLIEIY